MGIFRLNLTSKVISGSYGSRLDLRGIPETVDGLRELLQSRVDSFAPLMEGKTIRLLVGGDSVVNDHFMLVAQEFFPGCQIQWPRAFHIRWQWSEDDVITAVPFVRLNLTTIEVPLSKGSPIDLKGWPTDEMGVRKLLQSRLKELDVQVGNLPIRLLIESEDLADSLFLQVANEVFPGCQVQWRPQDCAGWNWPEENLIRMDVPAHS